MIHHFLNTFLSPASIHSTWLFGTKLSTHLLGSPLPELSSPKTSNSSSSSSSSSSLDSLAAFSFSSYCFLSFISLILLLMSSWCWDQITHFRWLSIVSWSKWILFLRNLFDDVRMLGNVFGSLSSLSEELFVNWATVWLRFSYSNFSLAIFLSLKNYISS